MESEVERSRIGKVTAQLQERTTGLLCQEGLPRAAALIWSLLIYTPGAWSIDELAGHLRLSKASVSLGTRLLEQLGQVERVFVPGERKVHFRIAADALEEAWEREMDTLTAFAVLLREGAAAVPPEQVEVKRRLTAFADFYDFLVKRMPQLVTQWKGRKEDQP